MKDEIEIADVDAHWIKRKLSEAVEELIPEDLIAMENKILSTASGGGLGSKLSPKTVITDH